MRECMRECTCAVVKSIVIGLGCLDSVGLAIKRFLVTGSPASTAISQCSASQITYVLHLTKASNCMFILFQIMWGQMKSKVVVDEGIKTDKKFVNVESNSYQHDTLCTWTMSIKYRAIDILDEEKGIEKTLKDWNQMSPPKSLSYSQNEMLTLSKFLPSRKTRSLETNINFFH